MSMKIAVIGATGYVGSKIIEEALKRSFEVFAITRKGDAKSTNGNLHSIAADAKNANELKKAISGCEVVVHAGAPPKNLNLEEAVAFQTEMTKGIIEASVAAGAKRIIAIGGAGTLLTNGKRNMDAPGFPAAFEIPAKSTEKVLDLMMEENNGKKRIPTTVLCPSFDLFEGERRGTYRTSLDETIFAPDGTSRISTSDLAVALVDEIENKKFIGKRFTAGY